MKRRDAGDNANHAIRDALRRQTDDALLRRMGLPPMEKFRARGIGFGVDLVRAISEGRKTQTRRLVRPQPTDGPPTIDCPAARVGEVLYVREPYRPTDAGYAYAADAGAGSSEKFRPAMYMPRRAARLWLRVTAVRAERLQAITPADLLAEGLPTGQSLAAVWDAFYPEPGQRFADDPWVWVIEFAVDEPRHPR